MSFSLAWVIILKMIKIFMCRFYIDIHFHSFGWIPRSRIAGFSNVFIPCFNPTNNKWELLLFHIITGIWLVSVFIFWHIAPHLDILQRLLRVSHAQGHPEAHSTHLLWYALMTSDVEDAFIPLLVSSYLLWWASAHFLLYCSFSYCWIIWDFSYISDHNLLLVKFFCNNFLSVAFLFSWRWLSQSSSLNFSWSLIINYFIHALCHHAFDSVMKKSRVLF